MMPPMSNDVFAHAVASGDPLSDRVLLWTRITTDRPEVEVEWALARDEALDDVVARGSGLARAEDDHTFRVDATGLDSDSFYYYGFSALGNHSPIARTRTLPTGRVARVRFAVCSCAKYTAGYFNGYGRIADRDDVAFLLHLGDYIYEYGTDDEISPSEAIGRPMDPPHECRTLEDYRRRHAHYKLDPDLRALHLKHPIIQTIDDHEICDNTWRDGAKKHDPSKDGPWSERKAAALRAWREWNPVRLPPEDPPIIYRSFDIGDLMRVVLLDGRTHRDEQAKEPEVIDDPDRSLLGDKQFGWLTSELDRSGVRWKVVGNDIMIAQVKSEFMPEDLGDPLSELGVMTKREHGPEPDQWDGYTAERERLFDHIERNAISNVVFVSGDVHSSWAAELHRDHHEEDDDPLAAEFVTTSLTTENLDEHLRQAPRTSSLAFEQELVEKNPHIKWCELDSHGFILVDVTTERVCAEWHYVDTLLERSSGVRIGAAFEVKDGSPQLHRVEDTYT